MKDRQLKTTRREFIQQTGTALAASAIGLGVPTFVPRRVLAGAKEGAPSDRILIGIIGVGNKAKDHLRMNMDDTIAVCDVDSSRLVEAKDKVEKANSSSCEAYSDYRRLLDNKDVNAVVIITPDHWHAQITMDACAAGKDVYCEKPLTLTIAEGQEMIKMARKTGRIVQTGSQQRSDARFRLAAELVRSGRLGKIQTVRVGIPRVNFPGPAVADSTPPPELNYDFWLGPAPQRPYNAKRVHYLFRFFWDYSGGQMTNFGAHDLDITQWALGMDESGPVSIEAKARYQQDHWYEVPEWCEVNYTYANGVKVICGQGEKQGVTFEGEKGSIYVTRKQITSTPEDLAVDPSASTDGEAKMGIQHRLNWLDSIKSRKLPICDVAIGHRSATVCHLGNIAIRTGRKIQWDPAAQKIVGDESAAAMVSRPYREPWKLPRV
jgi:predicted dehydrogenase